MATGMDIVNAAREYIGAPYRYWTGVYPEYGPPGYNDWQNPGVYTAGYVTSEGVHCAGLVNLARMECGLQPIGLTKQYSDWIWASGTGEYFDPNTDGVPGAICVIPWDPSTGAEGHVAIYTDAHTLIQATLSSGVWEGEQDYDSYQWAGYTGYGLMPDVDYSGAEAQASASQQTAAYVAIDAQGYLRLNGPDWSQGWYDAGWTYHSA